MPARTGRPFFGRNASVLLDVLRFAAAIAVALSHMPLHYVAAAPVISERSGNLAVCVFFVLSGFVIRYVTEARVTTGRDYWIDRASRMYSVVAPMLLLTFLLEPAAAWWSPTVYQSMVLPFRWGEIPGEALHNLTFTVGWWDWGTPPLSNGPFWSLSYECVYYALYGLWRFAPRARWYLMPLLMLASGPGITLLFPIWLLGVGLYDVYRRMHTQRSGPLLAVAGMGTYAAVLFACRRPILHFLQQTTVTARTAATTRYVGATWLGQHLFHGAELHWLDHFSLSFFLVGTVMFAALLPLLLILDRYVPSTPRKAAGVIRLVADSTFPLYLLHWPYFLFVVCLHGGAIPTWNGGTVMLLGAIGISIVLAMLFDRFKNSMRAVLRRAGTTPSLPTLHAAR